MRIASIGYIVERFALKQVICCQNRQRFSANHLDKVASSSIYAVFRNKIYQMQQSSSVWGCGLKSNKSALTLMRYSVILRVRMWIEIRISSFSSCVKFGHPPCEDVDWNVSCVRLPSIKFCHPPCEDVDWNSSERWIRRRYSGSSSVWGCGLKCSCLRLRLRYTDVILRVRMWIEIYQFPSTVCLFLRHPPCEDVDWNLPASTIFRWAAASSSVWGCGLKCTGNPRRRPGLGVILRVRMWIEMQQAQSANIIGTCHPPCEDVDWNVRETALPALSDRSSSVWGCGLKSLISSILACL